MKILLWIGLCYSFATLIAGLAWLVFGERRSRDGKTGLFLTRLTRENRWRVIACSIPDALIRSFSFPVLLPLVTIRWYFLSRGKLTANKPSLQYNFSAARSLEGGLPYGLIASGIWALCVHWILTSSESLGAPATVWLLAMWISWSVWLLSTYSEYLSLRRRIHLSPGLRYWRMLVIGVVFMFIYPWVATDLAALTTDGAFDSTYASAATRVFRVYTFRGIAWDGAKSGLVAVRKQPLILFEMISGILLYGSIVSKVSRKLVQPMNDEDKIAIASYRLSLGKHRLARKLLRTVTKKHPDVSMLWAWALLQKGEVEEAIEATNRTIPRVEGWLSNKDRLPTAVLLAWAMNVHLEPGARSALVARYLEGSPSEEELVAVFLGASENAREAVREAVASYGQNKRLLFFLLAANEMEEGDAFRRAPWCSVFASVHSIMLAMSIASASASEPASATAAVDRYLHDAHLCLKATSTGVGLLLQAASVKIVRESISKTELWKTRAQPLEDLWDAILDRVARLPFGAEACRFLEERR